MVFVIASGLAYACGEARSGGDAQFSAEYLFGESQSAVDHLGIWRVSETLICAHVLLGSAASRPATDDALCQAFATLFTAATFAFQRHKSKRKHKNMIHKRLVYDELRETVVYGQPGISGLACASLGL